MQIIIKELKGCECIVEASATTSILELKQQVEKKLKIPVEAQRLLFIGRALADEQLLKTYPAVKDGTKLNLVVKKPDGLYELSLKNFKKKGMTESQASKAANRLLQVVEERFNQLSLDDLQRLSADFLSKKNQQKKQQTKSWV